MQTATSTHTGQEIDRAIDCVLNNKNLTLDSYTIFMANFLDMTSYFVTSGGCNSVAGTMKAY